MPLHAQLDNLINTVLPVIQDFHARSELAPHAASMDAAGAITGSALASTDGRYLPPGETLVYLETKLRSAASAGEIVASGIFFHGVGLAHPPRAATTVGEAKAIVAMLEHRTGDSVYLVVPYTRDDAGIRYAMGTLVAKPPSVFPRLTKPPKPWWRFW